MPHGTIEPGRSRPKRYWISILATVAVAAFSGFGLAGANQPAPQVPIKKASVPQTTSKAMWGPASIDGKSQFPMYRDLGVGTYQLAIDWSHIAPTQPGDPTNPADPAYEWPASLARDIAEANRYGMKVMLLVMFAPPWANGGESDRSWAPRNPSLYADFIVAVSRKYPTVRKWMVWGEPNRNPNFKPLIPSRTGPLTPQQAAAPRLYGQILDVAYGALKAENRKNLIIGGNTYTAAGKDSISTYQWLRYMRLPNGRMPRMDLWGHNPFGFRKPNLKSRPSPKGRVDFSDLQRLTKKLDRYYVGKKLKLYLSEYGVPGGGGKDAEIGFRLGLKTQAQWIEAAFKVKRNFKRIDTLGWIHPYDKPEFGITTGLIKSNGQRKPGYYAFRAG